MQTVQLMGYGLYGPGIEAHYRLEIFHFSMMSRLALRPTQASYEYWDSSLEVKQSGHKVNHSCPPSAQVKNEWSYTSTPCI